MTQFSHVYIEGLSKIVASLQAWIRWQLYRVQAGIVFPQFLNFFRRIPKFRFLWEIIKFRTLRIHLYLLKTYTWNAASLNEETRFGLCIRVPLTPHFPDLDLPPFHPSTYSTFTRTTMLLYPMIALEKLNDVCSTRLWRSKSILFHGPVSDKLHRLQQLITCVNDSFQGN